MKINMNNPKPIIIIFIIIFAVLIIICSIPPPDAFQIEVEQREEYNYFNVWKFGYHGDTVSGNIRAAVFSIFQVFVISATTSTILGYAWTKIYSSKEKYKNKFWIYPIALTIIASTVFLIYRYPEYDYSSYYALKIIWVAQKRMLTVLGLAIGFFATIIYQFGIINNDLNKGIQKNYQIRFKLSALLFVGGIALMLILLIHPWNFWSRGRPYLLNLAFFIWLMALWYFVSSIESKRAFILMGILNMLGPMLFLYFFYLLEGFNEISSGMVIFSFGISTLGLLISIKNINNPNFEIIPSKKLENSEIPLFMVSLFSLFLIVMIYQSYNIWWNLRHVYIIIIVLSFIVIIHNITYTPSQSWKELKMTIMTLFFGLVIIMFAPGWYCT